MIVVFILVIYNLKYQAPLDLYNEKDYMPS